YYGFFSLFPLLLVLVTVLGFVLHGHPGVEDRILHSTLGQFPIIGDQLRHNVHSLQGSGVTLAIGIGGTLYGGLGVGAAAQNAMNEVWDVPITERPGFLPRLARSLLILVVVGLGILGTTTLSGLGTSSGSYGPALRIGALAVSTLLNVGLFALAFRILSARRLAWGDVLAGAIVAGIAWQVLQAVGGYYVSH